MDSKISSVYLYSALGLTSRELEYLNTALKVLDDKSYRIIKTRYGGDLSYTETAKALGFSKEEVRLITLKSLKILRVACIKLSKGFTVEDILSKSKRPSEHRKYFIDNIEFSYPLYNCLIKSGINTISGIFEYVRLHGSITTIKGLGKERLHQLNTILSASNYNTVI